MILTKRVIDLSDKEVSRCKELTFGNEGFMREDLESALVTDHSVPAPFRYHQAILYLENNEIVGWSLLRPVLYESRYEVHIFVDPDHRRRGIGSALLQEARKWGRYRPLVSIDEENQEFFMRLPELWS